MFHPLIIRVYSFILACHASKILAPYSLPTKKQLARCEAPLTNAVLSPVIPCLASYLLPKVDSAELNDHSELCAPSGILNPREEMLIFSMYNDLSWVCS